VVPKKVLQELPMVMEKFQINTPLRLAHFLSQCSHESGGFKVTEENLNYSVYGLNKVFGKYFPNDLATKYQHKPQMIASRVYGSRMGNGNEKSGDGWKYRGRGYIQLTGKNNYQKFDKFVDDDIINNPDLVSTKFPLLSAGWFWSVSKLNTICDGGDSVKVITSVTKRINGGVNGLDHRILEFNKIWKILK
jgi:putative chitinase